MRLLVHLVPFCRLNLLLLSVDMLRANDYMELIQKKAIVVCFKA
jgi:hypothetical protein